MTELTHHHEGHRVVDQEGAVLGTVDAVEDGVAHVEVDPGADRGLLAALGWYSKDEQRLTGDEVTAATDGELRIRIPEE